MSWLSKNLKWRPTSKAELASRLTKLERAFEFETRPEKKDAWQDDLQAQLHVVQQELEVTKSQLEATNGQLAELHSELFNVPPLPELRFLEQPIQDRLKQARIETDQFLQSSEELSTEEKQYLLMQMLFRGPVDHVKKELAALIESVDISESCRHLPVIDVGCGRGELLETLDQNGFDPIGVDTSSLMVKKLRERNLRALHGDALERLSEFADGSLCGVTAFHVIEHLQNDYFETLLRIAFQKTSPGGFLFLETPNPFCFESLSFFYTDSTHVRPIQPFQLAFLVESVGFVGTRAHFSAPVPATRVQAVHNWIRLYQNHGIVAYKPKQEAKSKTLESVRYGDVA